MLQSFIELRQHIDRSSAPGFGLGWGCLVPSMCTPPGLAMLVPDPTGVDMAHTLHMHGASQWWGSLPPWNANLNASLPKDSGPGCLVHFPADRLPLSWHL